MFKYPKPHTMLTQSYLSGFLSIRRLAIQYGGPSHSKSVHSRPSSIFRFVFNSDKILSIFSYLLEFNKIGSPIIMLLLLFPILLSIKRYLLPTELVWFSKSSVEQLILTVTTLDPHKSLFVLQVVNSLLQRLFAHMRIADLFKYSILLSILLSSLMAFSSFCSK